MPEDVINRKMQLEMSRGGSTKVEKYPGGIAIHTPVGGTSVTTPAETTETPSEDAPVTSDSVDTTIPTVEKDVSHKHKLTKEEKK